ncbi:MAG: hypothetical protein P9L97_05275 [Candidatus Tenebribacter davisii]|jgi:hypothetical protein|nr:hypothetical protein [Candidatus Tenebribacter davisii]
MKITIITFLIFFVFSALIAEEPTLQEKIEVSKKDWDDISFEFYISPVVVADVGIGISQRSKLKKVYQEGTIILHADLIPLIWEPDIEEFYKIYFWGAKFKSAYFSKADYSGFNWFFNVGFESFYFGIYNSSWIVFPDLAVGCGYSWKLKNDNYIRLSADAGFKILISNIYISYIW